MTTTIAVMLIVMVLITVAERRPAQHRRNGHLMVHSRVAVVFGGTLSLGCAAGITTLAILPANRNASAALNATLAFLLVVVPATLFFCDILSRRILVTANGITKVGRGGKRTHFRWKDVSDVRHDALRGGFVLSTNQRRMLISTFLVGQRDFARAVLRSVPLRKLQCRDRLEKLAQRV